MNLTKYLSLSAIFVASITSFNKSNCAVQSPEEITDTKMQEYNQISLLNATGLDLFISIKSGGHLALNAEDEYSQSKSEKETTQLFAKTLPSMSFTLIPVSKDRPLKNITFRIWLAQDNQPIGFYYKNLAKKSAAFFLEPANQAGLQHIVIGVEAKQIIQYLYYDFTEMPGCNICEMKFMPDEILSAIECGHTLHRDCLDNCSSRTECPRCHTPIKRHAHKSFFSICDAKHALSPISRLETYAPISPRLHLADSTSLRSILHDNTQTGTSNQNIRTIS